MTSILEHSFNFNGFNCYVILRHMGKSAYRCGYVQVSKRLPINTASINCHGGITYANKEAPSPLEIDNKDKRYIGFDCAHAFDTTDFWTVDRVSDELRQIVGQILSGESEEN
nr:MAG TPA: hypothetical protein [Caudoviricetes sp.]